MSGVAGTREFAAVPKRSLHDDAQTDEGQDGRSRRSPWPGLAIVLALRRRSAASEGPTSSLSLMQPLASRRTERAAARRDQLALGGGPRCLSFRCLLLRRLLFRCHAGLLLGRLQRDVSAAIP
jgi:hypothetical protein